MKKSNHQEVACLIKKTDNLTHKIEYWCEVWKFKKYYDDVNWCPFQE